MEDGNTLELNTTDSSQRLEHEDFKSDGKQLVYKHTESSGSPRFHLLQVPRGGEYALVLADGTRVWLNAETELSYPSYFSGKDRRVKLKGEAYFEVTADTSRPFIVETKHLTNQRFRDLIQHFSLSRRIAPCNTRQRKDQSNI